MLVEGNITKKRGQHESRSNSLPDKNSFAKIGLNCRSWTKCSQLKGNTSRGDFVWVLGKIILLFKYEQIMVVSNTFLLISPWPNSAFAELFILFTRVDITDQQWLWAKVPNRKGTLEHRWHNTNNTGQTTDFLTVTLTLNWGALNCMTNTFISPWRGPTLAAWTVQGPPWPLHWNT